MPVQGTPSCRGMVLWRASLRPLPHGLTARPVVLLTCVWEADMVAELCHCIHCSLWALARDRLRWQRRLSTFFIC